MRQYFMLFLLFLMSDVSLSLEIPCTVNLEEGVEYQKITWYKVLIGSGSLVGLVRKDIRTESTQLYKFANHSYQIGKDLSLLHVPEHRQEECEMYRCCVWPSVGHRILQSDYSFPQGCQRTAVGMTEFSSTLQGSNEVFRNKSLIIAGVLLLVILNVTVVVCLCKQRKKSTKFPLHASI